MTFGRSSFAPATLLPLAALLAACQTMPEVPFMGKKDNAAPAAASGESPTAAPVAAPAPAAAGTLPEPPSAPPPAARTALVGSTYSIDGAILPVMTGQQLIETRADMRRTDTLHVFDNRLLRTFAGETRSADIVRLDKKLVWTLNPGKKTYTECPLTGCRVAEPPRDKPQRPDKPSEPSEPSCPLTLKKNELKATPTGERRNINSFNTERIQVKWVMELADKQGRVTSNQVLLDLWTTPEAGVVKDVQAIDQAFTRRHAAALSAGEQPLGRYVPRDVMRSLGSLMGQMGPSSKAMAGWANEFKKVRGYPILTTLSWTTQGNACGDDRASAGGAPTGPAALGAMVGGLFGKKGGGQDAAGGGALLTYTHEVKTLDIKPVSDAWFAPAPDFSKVQP